MKIQKSLCPVLLIARAPCFAVALLKPTVRDTQISDSIQLDGREASIQKNVLTAAVPTSSPVPSWPTKGDIGTKDAPVDGLDGKPHAGPFVESLPVTKSGSISKVKPKPEDGVMNDPNRAPPRKGTTGTEGGVTEKERDRKAQEYKTGEKLIQKPDSPKEPPPVPLGKQSRPGKEVYEELKKKATGDNEAEKPKGAAGIEKPADLPAKPHDIPHPDPINRQPDESLKDAVITVDGLTSAKAPSQAEGVHDLIPWDSLAGSFSSIAATEIGDKTFIVAALMAMRYPRFQVFTAAYAALFIMTILSGVAGHAVGALISKRWAALVAAMLFLIFGVKSFREGLAMSPDQGVGEEMREVQAELEEKEVDMARQADGRTRAPSISAFVLESGRAGGSRRSRSRNGLAAPRRSPSSSRSPSPTARPSISSMLAGIKNLLSLVLSPAWVETFSMTFVGELGDRSQIATVAMAAGQEYYWVMVGACLGHFVCTAVAVLGGSVLAGRVSMRKVTLIGGATFLAFGAFTLFESWHYFF